MTPDEIERTMQFVLQQQAQFATDIQQITEKQRELQGAMITLTGMMGRLVEAQAELAQSHRELAKAQVHTEERLNSFITFVERYIAEGGRN
jgi:uncharacterized protein (DUF3084 family)